MTTTTETVAQKTEAVAALIEGYNVYVNDDGAGPYISINDKDDDDTYRCLSLNDEDECGEDITKYRWAFWTGGHTVYEKSLLGADAEPDRVLNFFKAMLQVEDFVKNS